MEYDEQAAIDYIRQQLPADSLKDVDDDEILNVIDIIWDYYDEKGFLEISADVDDDVIDEADLILYVKKAIAKDKNSPLRIDDIDAIVKAELEYEDSLETI